MAIIPILDIAAWLYPRDGASKVRRLWWNHSRNELARCVGRVETAALILTRCLLASPLLRTCGRERCWNLAVRKHSPQIFCCQLWRLTGDTDGSFPGNYNVMPFPIRNIGESWPGDLSTSHHADHVGNSCETDSGCRDQVSSKCKNTDIVLSQITFIRMSIKLVWA